MVRKQILRRILFLVLILSGLLCQSSIARIFSLTTPFPNILIMLVVFHGFFNGKREGMYAGVITGFLLDLFSGTTIGYNALVFMYIGYLSGLFKRLFYNEDVLMPLSLVAVFDFVYNFLFYVVNFLVRNKLNFGYYLVHTILPEVIFTVLLALVFYRPALKIHSKMTQSEKGSVETIA